MLIILGSELYLERVMGKSVVVFAWAIEHLEAVRYCSGVNASLYFDLLVYYGIYGQGIYSCMSRTFGFGIGLFPRYQHAIGNYSRTLESDAMYALMYLSARKSV